MKTFLNLIFLLCITGLVACGGKQNTDSNDTTTTDSTKTENNGGDNTANANSDASSMVADAKNVADKMCGCMPMVSENPDFKAAMKRLKDEKIDLTNDAQLGAFMESLSEETLMDVMKQFESLESEEGSAAMEKCELETNPIVEKYKDNEEAFMKAMVDELGTKEGCEFLYVVLDVAIKSGTL